MEPATSPAVIVLTLAAAAAVLGAWWLSIREGRRFRRLVEWIEAHHGARWRALPWFSRRLNPKGGVEFLRRHGLAEDPEFTELYRDAKRGNLRQLVFALIGLALIGVILLGARYLGWTW